MKADDGSAIAKLSEYILHSSGYNKDFPMLSGCVQSLKGNKEVKEAMVNEAWEELKDRYVKLAREEGLSEGMEIGKIAGIELGKAAGRSEGIDNVLEVMGISMESYLSSKREYDLKHNLA